MSVRCRESWNRRDVATLLRGFSRRQPVPVIAKQLTRTQSAVRRKAFQLGLIDAQRRRITNTAFYATPAPEINVFDTVPFEEGLDSIAEDELQTLAPEPAQTSEVESEPTVTAPPLVDDDTSDETLSDHPLPDLPSN
jgi:hypothetical protein